MKSRLTNSLEENEASEVEREYLSTSRLRRRIIDLLNKDIDALHLSMRNEEEYSNPSWAYKQAEKIGEVKALTKLISLLS
jgi:hypothetical protein